MNKIYGRKYYRPIRYQQNCLRCCSGVLTPRTLVNAMRVRISILQDVYSRNIVSINIFDQIYIMGAYLRLQEPG
jgi:hypothetical protein